LSPEEVIRFLNAVEDPQHRLILTTCYAAGLRVADHLQSIRTMSQVGVPTFAFQAHL
jgi:hypothetical protein